MYNYKHPGVTCPKCRTPEHVVYDHFHGETFCTQCGLVIKDNRLPRITLILQKEKQKEKWIRNLHKK